MIVPVIIVLAALWRACPCQRVINVNEIQRRLTIPAVADDLLRFQCRMELSFFQSRFDLRGFLQNSFPSRSLRACGPNAFNVTPAVGSTIDLTNMTRCRSPLRLTAIGDRMGINSGRGNQEVLVEIAWLARINYTEPQTLNFLMPNGPVDVDIYYMQWPSMRIERRELSRGDQLDVSSEQKGDTDAASAMSDYANVDVLSDSTSPFIYDSSLQHVYLLCAVSHVWDSYASMLLPALRWSVTSSGAFDSTVNWPMTAEPAICRSGSIANCSSTVSIALIRPAVLNVTCFYELTLQLDEQRNARQHSVKTFTRTVQLVPDLEMRIVVSPPRALMQTSDLGLLIGENENVSVVCEMRSREQLVASPHISACTSESCWQLSGTTRQLMGSVNRFEALTELTINERAVENVTCYTEQQRQRTMKLNTVAIVSRPSRSSILLGSASTFEASCAVRSVVEFEARSVQFTLADSFGRVTFPATRTAAHASGQQIMSGTLSLRDLFQDARWTLIWQRLLRNTLSEPALRLACSVFHPGNKSGNERVTLATREIGSVRFGMRMPRIIQNGAVREAQHTVRIVSAAELGSSWSCRWDCDGWCPQGAALQICVVGNTETFCDDSEAGRSVVTLNCHAGCVGRVEKLLQIEGAFELRCVVSYGLSLETTVRTNMSVHFKSWNGKITGNSVANSVDSGSHNNSVAAAIGANANVIAQEDLHLAVVSAAVGCLLAVLIAAFVAYALVIRRSTRVRKRSASRSKRTRPASSSMNTTPKRRPVMNVTIDEDLLSGDCRYTSLPATAHPHLLVTRTDSLTNSRVSRMSESFHNDQLCRCTCQPPHPNGLNLNNQSPICAESNITTTNATVAESEARTPSPPPPDLLTLGGTESPWRKLDIYDWQRAAQLQQQSRSQIQIQSPAQSSSQQLPQQPQPSAQRITPTAHAYRELIVANTSAIGDLLVTSPEEVNRLPLPAELTASGILSELLARDEQGGTYRPHAHLV